ncbi:endospore germination permease [Paenibacillus sp. FSL H7-0716]|uniref:Spore gernimation protein n=1 Tax=Paenibacillus odorifer TaxID=189426 RepID=A0A1R0YWI8_9BACL|nr:endospore germination permease [Paenibacillus odorifer]AWV32325.1 spore gernimation protein [Paenibacillus odorifer]OME12142.1 spore gernimation protein [Paenibacillus odorifer]OME18113.1 spore gernimation protein [Paenibacillus odorifer]
MSLEKDRISTNQMIILGLFTFIGDMALVYPALMISGAKQDAWIAALISIPLGLVTIKLLLCLADIEPNKNIIELSLQILGKWVGTAVALFYLGFFLIAASTYIREIEDFMCTQIYEKTPGGVIRFMAIFLLVYGVRLGLETLGRAAQLFFPLFAVFLIGLLLLLTPDVKMERLYPILNTPVPDMLHTLMYGVFYPFGELCVFLMIYPYAQKNSKTSRDIFIALIIGALGLNLILLFSLTVLGVYASEHQFYAAYILAQKINIANSLQRIEALMATAWIISTYFKTAVYYYALTLGTAQLFKLKSHRPLIIPTGFLLFGMSQLIAKDIIFYVKEIPAYWVDWDFTCAFVLPLMLLIVYQFKKRHASKV